MAWGVGGWLLTPFLMKMLAGQFIEISVTTMMWDISKMVILPIAAGELHAASSNRQ